MTDTATVILSHPYDGHEVGDRLDVAPGDAKRLVRAGVATYARASDAVAVEGEAGKARTRRAVEGGST